MHSKTKTTAKDKEILHQLELLAARLSVIEANIPKTERRVNVRELDANDCVHRPFSANNPNPLPPARYIRQSAQQMESKQ